MSDFERVFRIDQMLRRRVPPTLREIQDTLEISRATANRTLTFMRDRLGAPIAYDTRLHGYRYSDEAFEIPGLWFTPAELEALLMMQAIVDQIQPGLFRERVRPIEERLMTLIGTGSPAGDGVAQRVRVMGMRFRPVESGHFEQVCTATVERKKLALRYYTRSRDIETERVVSPQRMIYYRGNWYLDAWCHTSSAPRRFSLDSIVLSEVLSEAALEMSANVDPAIEGYGIFSGRPERTAVLRFDAEAARWVQHEVWHPLQLATTLPDGSTQLDIPYSHPRELLMDILRHGSHVEVLEPSDLRDEVAEAHRQAAALYQRQPLPALGSSSRQSAVPQSI